MFTNKNLEEFKTYVKGKYVAIMGMGVSNTPLIKYLMDLDANITVFDKKSEEELDKSLIEEYAIQGVKFSLGENYLKNLVGYDIIFRSPSMRPDIPELEKEIAERQEKVNKLSYINTEDISVRIKERDSLIEEVRNIKIEIEDYKKQKETEWITYERNFRRKKEELNNELESIRSEISKIKLEPIKINNLVVSKKTELSEIEREIENKSDILAKLEENKNEIDRLDEIEKIIEIRENDARKLEERRCELIKAVNTIEEQLNNKKKELEEVKQLIEGEYTLEEVDLNTLPKYDFANSSLCKDELECIREKAKEMVRNNTAVICKTDWTVNGSISKGRKMINDKIRSNEVNDKSQNQKISRIGEL